jgi:hypothetical protein
MVRPLGRGGNSPGGNESDPGEVGSRRCSGSSTSPATSAATSGSASGRRGPRLGRLGRSASRPLCRAGDRLARLAPAAPRHRCGFGRGQRTERLLRATRVGSFSITRDIEGACRQQVNECLHRCSPVGRLGWPGVKERIAAGACSAIGRWPYEAPRPYLKESAGRAVLRAARRGPTRSAHRRAVAAPRRARTPASAQAPPRVRPAGQT